MTRHPHLLLALASALTASMAAAADAPLLPKGRIELHGTFAGQPFWARLQPPDAQFGGNRMLELVYQPPAPALIGGAHLSDCPFILLDERARVVAWNGRESLSQVVPAAPAGYRVTRELATGEGDQARIEPGQRTIAGERGWDLGLAPLLLALSWHADGSGTARVVDLFGTREHEQLTASWTGARAELAGVVYTVVADSEGRVQSVVDAAHNPVLQIAGWTIGGMP